MDDLNKNNKVYRTVKLKIRCSSSDYIRLRNCNIESAEVWNELIGKAQLLYQKENKLYSLSELREIVKNIVKNNVCAINKKIVADQLFGAYKSISQARKAGRKDLRYPYKTKKYFTTTWDYERMHFDYTKNSINLTTARYKDLDGKSRNGRQIVLRFKTKIPNDIKTLKVVFEHGHYYACISYVKDVLMNKNNCINYSSIDMGEIHAIASIDNNDNQLIITGRKIRSIKQFRNKKQAELRSKMDRCIKGSNQYNKYRLSYARIKSKCRKQLDYHIHKLTRMYTVWAIEKGISVVYCGDVTGIGYGTNDKGNNITRQKINQWEYGKIMSLLEYKLGLEGIKFKKVSEAYSSQICPCCGMKTKVKNRNYICKNCEETFHRDIVGAWNILNFNYSLNFVPSSKIKYLRIV